VSFDNLGDRMKRYEAAARTTLPWRMPVVIRVDGRAFHTWTRGLEQPYCQRFADAMNFVAAALCAEVQGAELAYIQSDEVSILVHPYKRIESMPWVGNEVQKIVSLTAAVAAAEMTAQSRSVHGEMRRAHFDSRVFVLPEAEVCNYFVWRQNDATRNSLQSLARAHFSHKQLHGAGQSEMHEMLHTKGINWNDLPTEQKRGRCVARVSSVVDGVERHTWIVDREIPIFTKDRVYVERLLVTESEAA
jgi:tRNA(His) guanylyltransferase